MACLSETLGMSLPGSAAVPAVHADRLRIAEASGVEAVRLAASRTSPEQLITPESIDNALRVLLAIGGSTNAVIHLAAIAGRVGLTVDLRHLNELSESTPVLVNLKPTGQHYMEDFHAAGGVGAVLEELRPLLNLGCRSITGETLEKRLHHRPHFVDRTVIRSLDEPFQRSGGLLALFGNIAPNGSILKCAAADERLFEHEGRAVVFKDLEDLSERIDHPALDVEADDVLVLQNAGPIGAGMPEAGYLPIPAKLARAGVKDMVRISDARMSGTAFGTVILHASPEAAIGGPFGLVRSGDRIKLSVLERRVDVLVTERELEKRRSEIVPRATPPRGYARLYAQSVLGPEFGCDFHFLRKLPLSSG
jgi:dihydroxy-acid dehydratase